jgi:formylmethanofuran dehydrogenase subunit E
MFGAVPGVFKNLLAAKKAAEAYGIEERNNWVVVKRLEGDKSAIFCPCREEDLDQATERETYMLEKIRCNHCGSVFYEEDIVVKEEEEFCPKCNKSGALMDMPLTTHIHWQTL